ncbi:MAG TPA: SLBB domain-containing protein [Crinalium sp.]
MTSRYPKRVCSAVLTILTVTVSQHIVPAFAQSSEPVTPSSLPLPTVTPPTVTPSIITPSIITPSPGSAIEPYTLAAGDRINVIIDNVPEYSGAYQLLVNGSVDLPIIGNLNVMGMTATEAAGAIAQQYADQQILVQPVVSVILAEANIVEVAVTGEVIRPGAYSLQPNNGELPTLTRAIDEAGGITQQADLKQIQIRRQNRSGETEVIQASLWKLLTEGDLSQNIKLRDGDSIVLTTAPAIPSDMAGLMGRANVSPEVIQVNVVGEVNQAGLLQVPPNTPLNQVLLTAGGFTRRARHSVDLIRMNANGTVSRRRIEVDFGNNVNDETNPMLQNRDVIIVGRSSLARIADTLGTILSPIGGAFSLFNLFSPFFQGSSSP